MEIDNILCNMESRMPKKKSGAKGKRCELEVVKILNERFKKILLKNPDWGKFSRSAGSGNRWSQVAHLPKHARDTYGGDITCPDCFAFVLESKGGYNEIDLVSAFDGGHKEIDAFLKQSEDDAARTGRHPMLIWKKDRKPRLSFVKTVHLPDQQWEYSLTYRDWTAVRFQDLLKCNDSYFFPN